MNFGTRFTILWAVLCIQGSRAAPTKKQQSSSGQGLINPMDHDIVPLTEKSFAPQITRYRNADGVALVLQYSTSSTPLLKSSKTFINDVFNPVAKDLKGMVKVAAIDCSEFTRFCQRDLQNADLEYPHITLFPPNPLPPIVLQKKDKKALVSSALAQISDKNVQAVTSKNIDIFLTTDIAIPKVLLFSTSDKGVPVLFRALANSFKDRLSFGFIAASDATKTLKDKYGVKNLPGLVVVRPAAAMTVDRGGKPQVDLYKGPMQFDKLHDWLNVFSETFVRGGGFSEENGGSGEAAAKPWLTQSVPQLTGASQHDICLKGSSLCGVLLSHGPISDNQQKMMELLKERFPESGMDRGPGFRWMWLDLDAEVEIAKLFGSPKGASFAVINPHRRLRFLLLPGTELSTVEVIEKLLEQILAGDAKFTRVPGNKFPKFSPCDSTGTSVAKKASDEL